MSIFETFFVEVPNISETSTNVLHVMSPYELQTVATFDTAPFAWILRNRLASAGFTAFVADEHLVECKWTLGVALSGIKVMVPSDEVLLVRDYLATPVEFQFPDDETAEACGPEASICPACDSTEYSVSWLDRRMMFFTMVVLGFPLPIVSRGASCSTCNYQKRALSDNKYIEQLLSWTVFILFCLGSVAYLLAIIDGW